MKAWTRHPGLRRVVGIGVLALVVVFAASAAAANGPENAAEAALQPIDKQNWVDQGELTWADYHPVPDRNARVLRTRDGRHAIRNTAPRSSSSTSRTSRS